MKQFNSRCGKRNFRKACFLITAFLFFCQQNMYAQAGNAACNAYTPITVSSFSSLTVNDNNFNNSDNIKGTDINSYASWSYFIGGSAYIEIKDNNATGTNAYPVGSYAGFVVDNDAINFLSSVSVTTYSGSTAQETKSGTALLAIDLLNGKGKIGFTTTKVFDRIRISFSAFGFGGTIKVYYAEVNKPCAGPTPVCNVPTALVLPTYPATISDAHTGLTGITLGSISNQENVISSSATDYATISLPIGILASGSIAVKDQVTDYPAGYFAGFEVANASLAGVNLLANTTIKTYLNGTLQETKTNNQLLLSLPILTGSSRQSVGFVTTKSFDEIQYTVNQVVGVNLGNTYVFKAIIKKYCAGPALVCNTPVLPYVPAYPVDIDGALTGINGVACAACTITGTDNIIDNSAATYANITLTAGALVSGSVAVIDGYTTYPANTYAAFDIANPNLVGANVLSGITVSTYLNGTLVESKTGSAQLVSVTSSLFNGTGNQRVGFVATAPFDEVRLTITQGATLNLGTTQVFDVVFEKLCAGPTPDCSAITSLTNTAYPAVLDNVLTGVSGVACALCQVNNTANVVDDNTTNYASIVLTADVLASGSIAVLDPITDYPAGTFAGFDIENFTLVGANLLTAGKVSTYLNGVLQESTNGNLFSLVLLSASRQIVGFNTTKAFDEIRLTVGNVVGVNIGVTNVYRAVLKGASAAGSKAPAITFPTGTLNSTLNNTCPALTVNLNSVVTSTTPTGAQLVWFTTNTYPPNIATAYTTPDRATAGTYYAYYYDAVRGCYSLPSVPVVVVIKNCVLPITESGTVSTAGGKAIDNVVTNDRINGQQAVLGNSGNATISKVGTWPNGITLNTATGAVDVAPGTPIGLYPITYQLCDKSTPPVCATVVDFVTVTTILPADGLELKAVRNNSKIQLSWSTLTEQNTSYFVAEQSSDGINYTQAGRTAAAGTSNTKKTYELQLNDNSATMYYRIKLVDLDGKEKYSSVAIIHSLKAAITVYPVPAKNTIYLQADKLQGKGQVVILDLQGKQLQQTSVQFDAATPVLKFDISSLPTGIYVMRITSGNNTIEYRKFIVEK